MRALQERRCPQKKYKKKDNSKLWPESNSKVNFDFKSFFLNKTLIF